MRRGLPGGLVTGLVALLVAVFIAWPIGAVLRQSVVISGPLPEWRLKEITVQALDLLPAERRQAALDRWAASATLKERLEAQAAAFRMTGMAPPWDLTAAFDRQETEAAAALVRLPGDRRDAVLAEVPVATVFLHRRVALAFLVRGPLGPEAFETLRAGTQERIGLDHYLAPWRDPYLRRAALNSLAYAGASALLTTLLAFALAFAVNRRGVAVPQAVRALVLLPLVSPPTLIATAAIMLFGRRGLVTSTLLDRTLGWIDADVTNLYGPGGVVLAQVMSAIPAAFILLDSTMRRQDGRVEEAAAILGASRARAVWEVTLPLAWPGLKRALSLAFIVSLTDFSNPLLLSGRDVPVIAGVIYDEMTAFRNTSLAAALCVCLVLPGLLLYLGLERLGGRRRYDTGQGTGGAPELAVPRGWRAGLGALCGGVGLLVLLVYLTVALGSVTRVWGVDWSPTLAYFTAAGLDAGVSGTGYGGSDRGLALVWDSLSVAALAAPAGGLLGVVIAFVLERVRPPGGSALGFLALLPAVLPGLVFGLGYILAFNLPLGVHGLALTGGSGILVLNILFGHMFVAILAGRAALSRADPALEEAAEGMGAGLLRRFVLVTLPTLRTAFLLGTLYVLVHGMTTLSSVIFLVSGRHKLASVAIFNQAASGEYGYAAAKSVGIIGISGVAMGLMLWIERTRRRA